MFINKLSCDGTVQSEKRLKYLSNRGKMSPCMGEAAGDLE
jgi:hypothetical protein